MWKREASNLTSDFDGTSTHPWCIITRFIFFIGQRRHNEYHGQWISSKDLKQHTFFKGWDIPETPSIYTTKIVYKRRGHLDV